MKNLMTSVGVVALLGAGIFGLNYFGFMNYQFFLPRYQQVQYDTFKNTQSYNEGMIRHLYEIKYQYDAADDEGKKSLRQLAIHEFETYDRNRLPVDLQVFYDKLNEGM